MPSAPSSSPALRRGALARVAAALALAILVAGPARAQLRTVGPGNPDAPAFSFAAPDVDNFVFGGQFETNFQLDSDGRRGPLGSRREAFNESVLALFANIPGGFTLNLVGRFEPAARDPAGNRVLTNETGWLDELNLAWTRGPLILFGGKFHPAFGSAWERGPGLYGRDFGQEYELTEKLGFGARLRLSDIGNISRVIGVHDIGYEAFQADTTFLSTGAFARRFSGTVAEVDPETGETFTRTRLFFRGRRDLGGPDNRGGLPGQVASLQGSGIPMPRGNAGYTLSYSERKPGADATVPGLGATERGWTAGAFWTVPFRSGLIVTPFAEYARRDAADGFEGRRRDWLTAGAELRYSPWTFAYAFLQNTNRGADIAPGTRVQQTASVSYDLYFLAPLPALRSLQLTAGWRRLREDGVASNDFGAAVTWAYTF